MKIISWNVNGLRAVLKKGFLEWLEEEDPDVLLLQEVKGWEADLPEELKEVPGYYTRFHSAQKKGYSSVAIYTRYEPDEWIDGIGVEDFDREGRVISALFGDVLVMSAYFPNSQAAGARIDYRLGFGAAILEFMEAERAKGRHIVLGGDFNVSHEEIDLARPKENVKNAGFLPEERAWFGEFLAEGYVDTWRRLNPEVRERYSWWSFRSGARGRNVGWRLDYLCVDEGLWPSVRSADILDQVMGSDHCPVVLEIKNPK
jgi:exodeoxyribonuclease III